MQKTLAERWKLALKMYVSFFQIGLFTFGGGYAMLPMLEKECVDKHAWTTREELLDIFALAQCTPGIIAVNVATFIGHKLRGVPGAIAASLGFISPSIFFITLIAAFLESFASNVYVAHALAGIRVCVCVLILNSVLALGKKAIKNKLSWVIFLIATVLAAFTDVPTVAIVLGAGVVGYILYLKGAVKK